MWKYVDDISEKSMYCGFSRFNSKNGVQPTFLVVGPNSLVLLGRNQLCNSQESYLAVYVSTQTSRAKIFQSMDLAGVGIDSYCLAFLCFIFS